VSVRRVIRKQIRRREDGLDVAVDFNADVAVNVGRSQVVPADSEESGRDDPDRVEANENDREDS
jgi:hypothetical protein